MGAQWAIFAAALDPRVKNVTTQNGLAAWKLLLEHDRYHQASSQFIWGGLPQFDLPKVTALIAPRRVTLLSPTGHNKQALGATETQQIYAGTGAAIAFTGTLADMTV